MKRLSGESVIQVRMKKRKPLRKLEVSVQEAQGEDAMVVNPSNTEETLSSKTERLRESGHSEIEDQTRSCVVQRSDREWELERGSEQSPSNLGQSTFNMESYNPPSPVYLLPKPGDNRKGWSADYNLTKREAEGHFQRAQYQEVELEKLEETKRRTEAEIQLIKASQHQHIGVYKEFLQTLDHKKDVEEQYLRHQAKYGYQRNAVNNSIITNCVSHATPEMPDLSPPMRAINTSVEEHSPSTEGTDDALQVQNARSSAAANTVMRSPSTIVSAEVHATQPYLIMKTFAQDIPHFYAKVRQWEISTQKTVDRSRLVGDEVTKMLVNSMWQNYRPKQYEEMEWTDDRVPLEKVCLVLANTRKNQSKRPAHTEAKLQLTALLTSSVIKVQFDNTIDLATTMATQMEIYETAKKEDGWSYDVDKNLARLLLKAVKYYTSDGQEAEESCTQAFINDVRTSECDTFGGTWGHIMALQAKSRQTYDRCATFKEAKAKSDVHKAKKNENLSPSIGLKSQNTCITLDGLEKILCQTCGKRHPTGNCFFDSHPMANKSSLSWASSEAGRYFREVYQQDHLVVKKVYEPRDWFLPSKTPVVWSNDKKTLPRKPRDKASGEPMTAITAIVSVPKQECNVAMSETCQVPMLLTYSQEKAQHLGREANETVNVLLDTGNDGPDLISSDIAQACLHAVDVAEHKVINLVNYQSLKLRHAYNIQLAHPSHKYGFMTNAYAVDDLPCEVILGIQTIRSHGLFDFHPDLLHRNDYVRGVRRPSEGALHFTGVITKVDWDSNRSMKDPHSLEELAEVSDNELQAIPEELLAQGSHDTSWRKMLDTQVFGPQELQGALRDVLTRYKDCFLGTVSRNPANVEEFDMAVDAALWETQKNSGPVRRQNFQRQQEMERQIQILLAHNIIQPSSSPYYSHGFVVPKASKGKWRLVIDYRSLNAATTNMEHWPIPHIKELMNRIGAQAPAYFAVMDLTSGYHQMGMSEKARRLSAFMTSSGVYEWRRLPMGLKGAPSFFQRVMATQVLGGLVSTICELYMDDVIVFGKNKEEFLHNLEQVFDRFRKHNITVNPGKCVFGKTQVEYVGHVISKEGTHFTREKLDKVKDIELPRTVKQLQSFLGVANWFSSHVKDFAIVATPLTNMLHGQMTRRHAILQWTPEAVEAFEEVKRRVVRCPPLFFLDNISPIILQTDASQYGIGAALLQQRDDTIVPIALLSKKLNKVQINWSTPEKEAFAIYYSLKQWDYLLRDRRFILHTDHKNLLSLAKKCGANLKVVRWFQAIQDYDMCLSHIEGINNPIADSLSRSVAEEQTVVLAALESRTRIPNEYWKLIYKWHNCYAGHGGLERTMRLLNTHRHHWPLQRVHVRQFIRCCPRCQKMSQLKPIIHANRYALSAQQPMQQLAIDFIEGLPASLGGEDSILVIIDSFSRFVELYPCSGTTATAACTGIVQHLGRYGIPDEILTDNGPSFKSDLMNALCTVIDTNHIRITPYSHEENGIVERANKEVVRFLSDIVQDRNVVDNWVSCLPLVQRIMNAAVHETIGVSPASVVFGNSIDLDRNLVFDQPQLDVSEQVNIPQSIQRHMDLLINQQRVVINLIQTKLATEHRQRLLEQITTGFPSVTTYPIGSLVLVAPREGKRIHKLSPRWLGPMRVVNITKQGRRYTLQNLVTMKNLDYHVTQIKEYLQDPAQSQSPLQIALADHNQEYIVEKILDMRGNPSGSKTQLQFLVKWAGYEDTTWEPWSSLRNVVHLHNFLKQHPDQKVQALLPKQFASH